MVRHLRALARRGLGGADVHAPVHQGRVDADDLDPALARQGQELTEQYPELTQVRLLFSAACWLVEQGIRDGDVRVAEFATR